MVAGSKQQQQHRHSGIVRMNRAQENSASETTAKHNTGTPNMAPPTTTTKTPSHASLLLLLHAHTSSFLAALTPPSPPPSPPALLADYFTPQSPTIYEHGPPFTQRLLPFLGRPFTGRDECVRYFELMGAALELQIQRGSVSVCVDPDFTDDDDDAAAEGQGAGEGNVGGAGSGGGEAWTKCPGRAVATGRCHCVCRTTGRAWDEHVVWVFGGFERSTCGDGGRDRVRFARWDIWADAASAWVAAGGGDADSVGWEKGQHVYGWMRDG